MPHAIHEGGFPFTSFNHETALFIGSDRTCVVGEHPYPDAVQFHFHKSMPYQQTDRLTSNSFSKERRIVDTHCHGCSAILDIKAMKLDFPDKTSFDFDDPGVGIFCLPLSPIVGCFSCHWLRVRTTYPKHLNDIDVRP
ncbi:hypothetical protein PMI03_01329 [Rhizobium sp. AP16]|nr:hypothetical protein PMI03_01329 [Rhizobium sp. AP16]